MYVSHKSKGKGITLIRMIPKTKLTGGSVEDFYEWTKKHQQGEGIKHHNIEIPFFYEYYEKHTPYPRWEIPPNSHDKYATDYISRVLKLMMDYTKDMEGTNQLSTELKNEFVKIKHRAEMFRKEMESKGEQQELKGKISSIEKETKALNEDSMNNRYRAWKFSKAYLGHVFDHILSLIVGESKQTIDKITDFAGSLFSAAGQGEVKTGLDTVQSIGDKLLSFVNLPSGKIEDLASAIKKSLDQIKESTWDNLSPSQQESEIKKGFNPNKSLIKGHGLKKNKDVQTILFSKEKWTVESAKKWLSENGFISPKVDITKNKLRFRQKEPEGGRYATKKLSDGIELVFEYPNEYNSHLRSGRGLYGGSANDMDKKKMISKLYKIIDELNARKGKLMKENANQAVIQDIEDEIQEARHYIDIHGNGLYGGMVKPTLVLLSIDTMDLNEVKEILPAWINANSIERKHTKRILDGIDLDNPGVELHEGVLNYLREIKADYRQRAATQRRANRPPRFEPSM